MNNKFINYVTVLVESKNDENKKLKVKIFSIIFLISFAIFLFFFTFLITLFYTNDIVEVKNKRDKNLTEMMRVNMGEIPNSPSVVRFKMAVKIDSVLKKTEDSNLKGELKKIFNPYLHDNDIVVNELSEKFINNPEVNFSNFFNAEKQILNKEIKIINDSITRLSILNNQLKSKFDFLVGIKNKLVEKKDLNYNDDSLKPFTFLNVEEKKILKNQIYLKYFIFNLSAIDSLISVPIKPEKVTNEGLEQVKEMLKKYDENSIVVEINKNTASIVKLNDEKIIKERNQVSLETYRKNKAYIFQNQFDICKLSIEYCINEGMRYFAFYRGLIVVILIFSALMSICVFAVSAKGWTGSDPVLKIITMTVIVILGMSNLINLVLSPKENYISYIKKAEKNEAVQAEIIKFFNNYNNLKEDEIDKLIKSNFDNITKFSEILPETNDAGLKEGFQGFNDLKTN